jgi:hypothetical protein
LVYLAAVLFGVPGLAVAAKGLWDCFGGEPEANSFSPQPWAFVSREEWVRWAGFELALGLAFLGVAWALGSLARRMAWSRARDVPADEVNSL